MIDRGFVMSRLGPMAGRVLNWTVVAVVFLHIWEYQSTTLHAKTFVVDGLWSSIGTMNFDNRSLALNDEATLMVRDSTFGRRMEQLFQGARGALPATTRRRRTCDQSARITWKVNRSK
jgi:phosphatidylserine/phosphatidylglycerophosphate/cardiolipin synthase-like enzyme